MTSLLIIATTLFQGGWTTEDTRYLNDDILLRIEPGNQFLFPGGWTTDVARPLNDHQERTALLCIKPQAGDCAPTRSLPPDIFRHLREFIPIDDWSRLNLVFNLKSPKLQHLKQWVKENRNEIRRRETFEKTHVWSVMEDSLERHGRLVVSTDGNGNIVKIWANWLGLKDEDILDLSKLPPTLEGLDLSFNDLTKVDLRNPPRNLEVLNLTGNQLREFNINNAPKTLRKMDLRNNQLHQIDISSCKGIPERKGQAMIVNLVGNPSDLEVISIPPIEEGQWKNVQCAKESEKYLLKVPAGDPSNDNFIQIFKTKENRREEQ